MQGTIIVKSFVGSKVNDQVKFAKVISLQAFFDRTTTDGVKA